MTRQSHMVTSERKFRGKRMEQIIAEWTVKTETDTMNSLVSEW